MIDSCRKRHGARNGAALVRRVLAPTTEGPSGSRIRGQYNGKGPEWGSKEIDCRQPALVVRREAVNIAMARYAVLRPTPQRSTIHLPIVNPSLRRTSRGRIESP
jgi:hypothetical protein